VEPEPGCVLDTLADAVGWLAGRVEPDVIGICLDTCHLAVSFADPAAEIGRIAAAGLSVVKVQASAALQVEHPGTPEARAALAQFAEPRYLHQVRELAADGTVLAADDLPDALDTLPGDGPWRVHFHVPLHERVAAPLDAPPDAPLSSTTDVLTAALAALGDQRPYVEVETYTWSVLPGGRTEQDVIDGIAAELSWAARALARPMEVCN
ncbi:MAG TPA: hypothetical protein VMB79_03565, partial [Jatrophihabitans sp.]|nr:hypothetical protein [Jatrophihabitans sp.]